MHCAGTCAAPYCSGALRPFFSSHDLEDIINVIDGRAELLDEIATAAPELRIYLGQCCAALLATPQFANYLPGLLAQDETLEQRVATATSHLQSIAAFAHP